MRNADGCAQLGDARAGKRLANALCSLQTSLQNMIAVETEMKERFEGFRRALNQISDNAREIAERRELRGRNPNEIQGVPQTAKPKAKLEAA
jgi:hypothetical protein